MSADRHGLIPAGSDMLRGASLLAGAMAERGVERLAISAGAGWATLEPRATDLPGLIAAAWAAGEPAELVALDWALRVEILPEGLRWFTTDGRLADALTLCEPEID